MTTAPTASLGQVERVATSWAMRTKYSSQDGRAFLSAACCPEVSTDGSLKRSIQPVPRVAEARHDECPFVELRVDGGGVEARVGVLSGHPLDPGRGGDGVKARDPTRPVLF